ncbi:nucleotide exchange factor GrpE [Patescibacteria group bacterium]
MVKKKKTKGTKREADLHNQLKRALADYDNLSKRVERQQEVFGYVARARFLYEILPAIDMFEKAHEHLGDGGLAIAMQTLDETLKMQGFSRIDANVGDKFDENLHEAVDAIEDEKKKNGEIVEIKLVGWKSDEGAVRPTKVVVNRKK